MADEEPTVEIVEGEQVLVYGDGRRVRDPSQPSTLAWLVAEQAFYDRERQAQSRASRLLWVEKKRERLSSRAVVPSDKRAL